MRFSEDELDAFSIDPTEPAVRAVCPFCGQDVVMGVRKDTRNVTLAHAALKDPALPTGDRYISGCEPFRALAMRNPLDYLRACKSQGVRWTPLTR